MDDPDNPVTIAIDWAEMPGADIIESLEIIMGMK